MRGVAQLGDHLPYKHTHYIILVIILRLLSVYNYITEEISVAYVLRNSH